MKRVTVAMIRPSKLTPAIINRLLTMTKFRPTNSKIAAVDLFCGAGGLTHGLIKAGISVVAGIDIDPACQFPFEANNKSKFVLRDVGNVIKDDLLGMYPPTSTRILVGCAPCQPFSRYSQAVVRTGDQKWAMLEQFARLVTEVHPTVISMENVPELARHEVFLKFVKHLKHDGYHVSFSNVFCPDFGIAQHRTRLVLFASLTGPITLIPSTHRPSQYRTVKQAISTLPTLSPGEIDGTDSLHRASHLSDLNLRRIRVSKPGGCWRDWPPQLVAKCHQKKSGETFPSVYGRMEWDRPAPTITTQFFGYGNGRFGHPEQDRAISLREGAILQSFPRKYRFCQKDAAVSFATLGRLIGNAVPVRLGEVIGKSILKHIAEPNG